MLCEELHKVLSDVNAAARDLEYRLSVLLALAEAGSVAMMPRAAGEVLSSAAMLGKDEELLAQEARALAGQIGAPGSAHLGELAKMLGEAGPAVLIATQELSDTLESVSRLRDNLGRICTERIERLRESMSLLGVQPVGTYGSKGRLTGGLSPLMNEAV
ncbi:MAG: hypothetical protein M0Z47_10025 [Actinomycetota bacterium]|nr:hypothetical protein [Actinomycetota bacterium]